MTTEAYTIGKILDTADELVEKEMLISEMKQNHHSALSE